MGRNYTLIQETEMRDLLESYNFKEIHLDGTREIVYGKILAKNLCFRIYTSIDFGSSRGVGKDAIRCCLVYRKKDGTIVGVGKDARVYRIETWKQNLKKRVESHLDLMGPICYTCGVPMKKCVAKTSKDEFFGCINYPTCKKTKPLEN